jgi:polar amino acid transport system substrate-binding protein
MIEICFFGMRVGLIPAAGFLGLLSSVLACGSAVAAPGGTLNAVIFEEVKPLFESSGSTYDGLGVDVLNQIKDQAGFSSVSLTPVNSVSEGLKAIRSGKADIACGVAFTWNRVNNFSYSLPFGIGGTRLLTKANVDGTPDSLAGLTVGVVKGSASAKVLKNVVPGITLKRFDTPSQAFDAFNSGAVTTLGGGTLWLAANSSASSTDLVPLRPYGRSGIGCIVNQSNGALLSKTNIALGQMMQAYVDGDAGTREMINRWIGPGSSVKLSETAISALYSLILSTTAEMSTAVEAGN